MLRRLNPLDLNPLDRGPVMTQQPTQPTQLVGVDKAGCAVRLSHPARLVHQQILITFAATGQPPTRGGLQQAAAAAGVDLAAALAELTRVDLIVQGPHGELLAAYPFSATPTAHRLTLHGGTRVSAMCAIDALGVSAMLAQPVTVTSTEPGSDQPVTVHVDGDRATWNPPTAVVLAGADADCCATSAERTCGHINFFATRQAAHAWAGAHPELTWTLLDQAQALVCATAQFGPLLDQPA